MEQTRKPKEKHFTVDIHVFISPEQSKYISSLKGGTGFNIRSMIDAHMGLYSKEEEELINHWAVVETEYFELKKRLEQIEDMKRQHDRFVSGADYCLKHARERIPDDVQMFVWKRDEGKCVVCGGNKNLEFDHIIPVSKGGSNTPRNIQLMCEKHNRHKGDGIGIEVKTVAHQEVLLSGR